MEKFFIASEVFNGITLDVISSQRGIRNILINSPIIKRDQPNVMKLRADDPYMFKSFKQLREYFENKRKVFDLPLEIIGTDFQKRVWKELTKILYGETISYKELAIRLGNLKTIRAAARANGANPLPIIIPCHRVIGSDGKMVGYGGGLNVKEKLLELEGSKNLELFS
jgi:methylated-DNA-[protein]-cysteine S-methyltransferase